MNQKAELDGICRAKRVKHSYTQSINGTPEEVFPLLCPVREADWIPGWSTDYVISNSGVAEQDCIFQTPAQSGSARVASIWVITHHDQDAYKVEMYKVTPEFTVGKLQISLKPQGTATSATITYTFTSLGPQGDVFLEAFTAQWYEEFMRTWEAQMNHYLETGEVGQAPDMESA